jgi:hypothetical protein
MLEKKFYGCLYGKYIIMLEVLAFIVRCANAWLQ